MRRTRSFWKGEIDGALKCETNCRDDPSGRSNAAARAPAAESAPPLSSTVRSGMGSSSGSGSTAFGAACVKLNVQ